MKSRSRMDTLYDRYLRKQPKQSRSRTVVEAILTATADVIGRTDDDESLTVQQVAERMSAQSECHGLSVFVLATNVRAKTSPRRAPAHEILRIERRGSCNPLARCCR